MMILYIILGIIALFLGMQFFMVFKMRMKKGKPAPSLSGKLGQLINSGQKALFYFYSPGCRACRDMTPVIQQMSRRNKRVVPVDISKDMSTAQKFGVMGTPSTVLVQQGVIREFMVGPQPVEKLKQIIS